MRLPAALLLSLAFVSPVAAQERSASQRQTLTQLARALGEAHALRIVCEGRDDQRWRNRMHRVIELEQADSAFEGRLRDSFNTGFQAAEASHVACDAAAKSERARVAQRGRDLAARLSEGRMETASAR